MIRDNVRVLRYAALVAVADLRAIYTWKTWAFAWLSRILFQVAFFSLIGKLLNSIDQTRYLLIGNSVFIVTMVTMFVSVAAVWERQSGTLPLLIASPSQPLIVFIGRSANWLLDGTVCATISLFLLSPVFGLRLPWPLALLAIPLIVCAGLSTYCLALALAGIVLRRPQLRNLVTNLAYLSVMLLAGVQFPVTFLPEPLRYAAAALPLTHALAAIRGLLSGTPAGHVLVQAGLEAAVCALWFVVALVVFRQLVEGGRRDGAIEFGD